MTKLERVAMQQALEALEMYRPLFLPIKLLSQDKTREEAITALREALAEQAKQEPVAWKHDCAALCANHVELWIDNCPHCGKPRPAPVQQAEQEPVGYFAYDEEHDIWEELTGPNAPGATPLYTAPARTKDLTDDELMSCRSSEPAGGSWLESARAVIAKFKEKNK